jgi:dihydrofolate reductase
MNIKAAVAITLSNGIGFEGKLPWVAKDIKLSKDLAYFKNVTSETKDKSKRNAVVMGRITWESISDSFRPLKNRLNVVITQNSTWADENLPKNAISAESLNKAIEILENHPLYSNSIESIVVIGGTKLFEEAIYHPKCIEFHVTRIEQDFECDTFLNHNTMMKLNSLQPIISTDSFIDNGISMR